MPAELKEQVQVQMLCVKCSLLQELLVPATTAVGIGFACATFVGVLKHSSCNRMNVFNQGEF